MSKFLNNINLESGNDIQFKTTAGANAGKIEQDGNNLVLSNAVGDVLLGDGSSDVFIGDGTNNVDILFEQSGSIKGDGSAVTLTIGGANTTLNLENPNINGTLSLGATSINNKFTFTSSSGYILFDHEPSGDTGDYEGTTSVPLLKIDRGGTEKTILERVSEQGGLLLGADDSVIIAAGDTRNVLRTNLNEAEETVVFASEGGFKAYGFPSNDTTWSNRNEFRFRSDSGTASDNGLYIGDGSSTQFIDLSRNLKNIGTINSGAITSTGSVTATSVGVTNIVTNRIVKFNGSILDDSVMYDDGTNIGIGTTSLSRKLHVAGDIELDGGGGLYGGGTDFTYLEIANSNYHHKFFTRTNTGASLERFTIEGGAVDGNAYFQNTNVGIGTNSPSAPLQVFGTSAAPSVSGTFQGSIFSIKGSSTVFLDMGTTGASGYYAWMQAHDAGTGVNYKLAINPLGGNVGIGTTSPSEKLDVNGAINSTSLHVNGIDQHSSTRYTLPSQSVSFARTAASNGSDQWFKIYSSGGSTTLIRLNIVSGGDNTQSNDEFLISVAGYGFKHHIQRLPAGRYNGSKLLAIATTNPSAGGTVEIWVKLDGMVSGSATTYIYANAGLESSSNILSSATGTAPTITSNGTQLDIGATQRNEATIMASRGATFGGNVGIGTTSPEVKLHVGTATLGAAPDTNADIISSGGVTLETSKRLSFDADYYVHGNIRYIGSGTAEAKLEYQGYYGHNFITRSSSRMVIKGDTGNVGIGTTNPSSKLVVADGMDGGNSQTALEFIPQDNNNRNIIFSYDRSSSAYKQIDFNASDFQFTADGQYPRMVIENGGNVGIGTTSPSGLLQVGEYTVASQGNQGVSGNISSFANSDTNNIFLGLKNGAYPNRGFAFRTVAVGVNSDFTIYEHGQGSAEVFRITAGGNVGIGTTSPDQKLQVIGDVSVGKYDGTDFDRRIGINSSNGAYANGSSYIRFQELSASGTTNTTKGCNIRFYNHLYAGNTNETLVIQANGNVGIGTTSPSSKLTVGGNATGFSTGMQVWQSGETALSGDVGGKAATFFGTSGLSNSSIVNIYSTDAYTTQRGGEIGFGGKYRSTGGVAQFAKIRSFKTNSSDGGTNYGGGLEFWTRPNGSAAVARMTILGDGNVGIGTTSPSTKLEVAATATTSVDIAHFSNSNGVVKINHSLDGVGSGKISILDASNNEDIRLSAQGDSWFNAGNVGIGTNSPSAKLHIDVATEDNQPAFKVTKVSDNNENAIEVYHGTSSSTRGIADFTNALGSVMYLRGDGNVGIGTTSPADKLHVYGGRIAVDNLASQQSAIRFFSAGTEKTVLYRPSNSDDFRIFKAGISNDALTILNSNGNVGIGTNNPIGKLTISDSGGTGLEIHAQDSLARVAMVAYDRADSAYREIYSEGYNFNFNTSGTNTRLSILNNGNVGIGTTGPASKLHVAGTASIDTLEYNSIVSVFGQSRTKLNELSDVFYQADKRFTVTGGSPSFFNGSFDQAGNLPTNTTNVINVNVAGQQGVPSNGITYPEGAVYISFYYTNHAYTAISLRHKSNGVYYSSTGTDVSTNSGYKVIKFPISSNNYLTDIEISITTDANLVKVSAINYLSDRWNTQLELPYVSKYLTSNTVFGEFGISGTANNSGPHLRLEGTYTTWELENQYTGGANNDMFRIRNTALSSDALVINRGNNRIGIGLTDPSDVLQVKSSMSVVDSNGTNVHCQLSSNASEGVLRIHNGTNYGLIARGSANNPYLGAYYGGSLNIVGFGSSDGSTIDEQLAVFDFGNSQFKLYDSKKLVIGDDADLQIYHNGTESNITNATGNFYISQTANDADIIFECDNGSGGITEYFRLDGSAEQNVVSKNMRFEDNIQAQFGEGTDLRIYHNGSHSYIDDTGTGNLYIRNGTKNSIWCQTDGAVQLYHNDSARLQTTVDGIQLYGNGYLDMPDNGRIRLGASYDLAIYHNGTHSYLTNNVTGSLYIQSGNSVQIESSAGENMIVASANGAVQLYFDNSKKLETTSAGVDITGITTSNAFRTDTSNTDYNVISRNSTSTTLWVQAAQSNSLQGIASFRYGSATVNQGTEVFRIRRDGVNVFGTNFTVGGTITGNSKNFSIPHPTKEGKRLVHSCLEGPEIGVYFRGRSTSATIEMPDYWSGLVHLDSMTVELTAIGPNQDLYVANIADDGDVTIASNTDTALNYFYVIYGERKDLERLEVEIDDTVEVEEPEEVSFPD